MKNYRITVNGVAYDVAVEELGAGEASAAPVSTPAAAPAPAKKAAPKTSGSAGAVKITAPMPGKIVAVKAQRRPFFTGRCFCKEGQTLFLY